MTWRVEIQEQALDDLRRLDHEPRPRILKYFKDRCTRIGKRHIRNAIIQEGACMNVKPFLAAILLLTSIPAAAATARLSRGGCDFRVDSRQRGDRLYLSGRVSGQACHSLAVTS